MDAPRLDPTSDPLRSSIMHQDLGRLHEHHPVTGRALEGTGQHAMGLQRCFGRFSIMRDSTKGTADGKGQTENNSSQSLPSEKATSSAVTFIQANTALSHLQALLKPVALLIASAMLAIGHHLFNNWANGRPVGSSPSMPQVWVFRVGTAFAFAFQTVLAACLGFVICQLLWFSTRRNFLTIQDINTLYLVERRDIVSTITSNAIRRAPFLVIVTLLSFLLPIAAVFTPASLAVSDATHSDVEGSCVITTGNFTGIDAASLAQGRGALLSGFTPTVQKIAEAAFYGGAIIPLPAYCGQNCTYFLTVDSCTFSCQPDVTLPNGQMGTFHSVYLADPSVQTFWNATLTGSETDHDPTMSFYVGWATEAFQPGLNSSIGSSGSAYCTPMQARYEFRIQNFNGLQTVSYTITPTGPMISVKDSDPNDQPFTKEFQLGALTLATRHLLLGSLSVRTNPRETVWSINSIARAASFLDMGHGDREQFVWGDVIKGIEQTAANVTASLLTMDLGLQNSTCLYTQTDLIYVYHQPNLWIPYGIALFIVTLALIFGVLVFLRYNPDNLTTSFTDTVGITRDHDLDGLARLDGGAVQADAVLHSMKYRLGALERGRVGYGTSEKFELKN